MHGDAPNAAVEELALAGVETGPDLEPERPHGAPDRGRAADRTRRPVEGREEAVAGHVHLVPAEARELMPDAGVMRVEELAPAPVAELGGVRGRADDVGEEHRREDAVRFVLPRLTFPGLR